jgi:hypothetical protein
MKDDLEAKLLKDTVLALREELEKVHHEEREHIQQAVADANSEIGQLRAGVVDLRERMELLAAEHEDRMQNMRLQHQHELAELHQTITALRAQLEKVNEGNQSTRKTAEAAGTTH